MLLDWQSELSLSLSLSGEVVVVFIVDGGEEDGDDDEDVERILINSWPLLTRAHFSISLSLSRGLSAVWVALRVIIAAYLCKFTIMPCEKAHSGKSRIMILGRK